MVLVPEEEYFHGAVPRQKAEGALISSKHDGEQRRRQRDRESERQRDREKREKIKEGCLMKCLPIVFCMFSSVVKPHENMREREREREGKR
jgi:hypothetical protein